MKTSLLSLAALVAATPTVNELAARADSASLPTITTKGNAFYKGDTRFFIRGLDYQPGGSSSDSDPLADKSICSRDIPYFKDLGINVIRVYMVDNSKDHDECMALLADAGIYLVVDVNTPEYSLNRLYPYLSYNAAYLQNVFATVEMFSKYSNVLAFFSGNEVMNEIPGTTVSAPYVKALTRDIKAYQTARKLRNIPLGYSAADVAENRMETAHYMNCGPDSVRSDFFAFNDYSLCSSDYETAGWDVKVKNFTDYGVPIFLSEFGCNTNTRDWREFEYLMDPTKMTGVYSGGLAYEYTMESNKYGIVEIDGSSVKKLTEYNNLKSALSKYPAPTGTSGAAASTHSNECPSSASNWEVDPTFLPAMPTQAQKYFTDGPGKGLGFSGKGSQTDGDSGLSTNSTVSKASNSGGSGSSGSNGKDDDENQAAGLVSPSLYASLISLGLVMACALAL
jgi:hypothetical protein